MEAPQRVLEGAQRARKRRRWIVALVVVLALLVVIVPCAVLLPEDARSGLTSTILLPLYIYPVSNAWDPLYRA